MTCSLAKGLNTSIVTKMKSKSEFIIQIKKFNTIKSKSGKASYSNFKLDGSILSFMRDNTGQRWLLDIDAVYDVYKRESFINTVVLRKYISGRTYSPSLAILIAAGFCDESGNRVS